MSAPAPNQLGRQHARRLREVYSSAGWPWLDVVEVDLLAAGLLERQRSPQGQETVRVTDAGLAQLEPGGKTRWKMCEPDVFSIRNSSVQGNLEPVVHEIKVSRADLLGDLKRPDKRQAYLDIGGQCWYVLGCNAKGLPIASTDEVPPECGVMLWQAQRLHVLRMAPKRSVPNLPCALWMALAKGTPLPGYTQAATEWADQAMLNDHTHPNQPPKPSLLDHE